MKERRAPRLRSEYGAPLPLPYNIPTPTGSMMVARFTHFTY